jgi:hypothetical protein
LESFGQAAEVEVRGAEERVARFPKKLCHPRKWISFL